MEVYSYVYNIFYFYFIFLLNFNVVTINYIKVLYVIKCYNNDIIKYHLRLQYILYILYLIIIILWNYNLLNFIKIINIYFLCFSHLKEFIHCFINYLTYIKLFYSLNILIVIKIILFDNFWMNFYIIFEFGNSLHCNYYKLNYTSKISQTNDMYFAFCLHWCQSMEMEWKIINIHG